MVKTILMPFEVYCPTTVKSVTKGTFQIKISSFRRKVMNHNLERQNRKLGKTPEEIMDEINISELIS